MEALIKSLTGEPLCEVCGLIIRGPHLYHPSKPTEKFHYECQEGYGKLQNKSNKKSP